MTATDQIELWLNSVAYEHSQSKATEDQYKRVWRQYTKSINMTAEQIIEDYENAEKNNVSERTIKRKHSQKIQQWIIELTKKGLAKTSIKVMVGAVMSFYKYNDLPLGHIPLPRTVTTHHNRDIEKNEINKIMALSNIREKAIFAIMAQSGLRPHTIKQLKIKHLEKILEPNPPIPCKITIPKEIEKGKFGTGHPTFIAEEAVKYTKQYLATRTNLTPDSLLFTTQNNKPINTKNTSRSFRLSAKKLKEAGAINYKIRKGKPSELRLYNLRKYFRKYANQMGFEHVNYLMGHTAKSSDSNYTPKDDEFYRKLYKEKAMEFLRFEEPIPTETGKIIKTLEEQHQKEIEELQKQHQTEIKEITKRLAKIENIILPKEKEEEYEEPFSKEEIEQMEKEYEEHEKWLEEHPEEREKELKERKKLAEKYAITDEEYIEMLKGNLNFAIEEIKKRDKQIKEILRIIKRKKETKEQT